MTLSDVVAAYRPRSAEEAADVARQQALVGDTSKDPWTRSSPLHATGSAVVLHPPTRRVLLRWHDRQQNWLQVGGHADPGETDPFLIALREAGEETGLADLARWPDQSAPTPVQITIVPVPAGKGEPAHEHADVRYLLSTHQPDAASPETDTATLRWLALDEALSTVAEDNLRICLLRIIAILGQR